MGLDSFWKPPEGEELKEPTFDPPLRLCGGMFSANGQGSFRGKVYEDIVLQVTGESLYQERITNDTCRRMAEQFRKWADEKGIDEMEVLDEDASDLLRMFEGYAEAGFELLGWW